MSSHGVSEEDRRSKENAVSGQDPINGYREEQEIRKVTTLQREQLYSLVEPLTGSV